MEMIRLLIRSLVTLLLIGLFQVSYAVNVDKIVAFGDSLSDNGNLFAFTTRIHSVLPVVPIIPVDPPYYKGRFTNGENWLDILSKVSNLPLLDHAYGGAWAESVWDSAKLVPFDIGDQVSLYILENALDRHKDRHLFTIWAGANDYLDGREDIDYATTNTVGHIIDQVERLIYHGAHQLLVISLPDISKTPGVIEKGPRVVEQAKALIEMHNKKLAERVKEVQEKNPDLKIVFVDAKEPFDDLVLHPERNNLKVVDKACYSGYFYLSKSMANQMELDAAKSNGIDIMNNPSLRTAYLTAQFAQRGGQVCQNPDEYLFWDQIHPTRVIHQVIAVLAVAELRAHDIDWEDK